MRVPVLNLPVVYHVGTLDPGRRGQQWAGSYEGAGLSVSLCPEAWEQIARLGGSPWHACVRHDALYLDLMAMDDALLAEIQVWARDAGLIEQRAMWKSWYWDEERENWSYLLSETREDAICQLQGVQEPDEDPEAFLDRMNEEEEGNLPSGASSLVEDLFVYVLSEQGMRRAGQRFGQDQDATDMAIMFWAEDVLRAIMPEVVGVWWNERYDPNTLSAPRGAILPSCLESITFAEADRRRVDEDEELLASLPQTRLVSPQDLKSPYRYVTNCVRSTAELIGSMVDNDAAVEEIAYRDFVSMLGDGDAQAGEEVLHEAFPPRPGLTLEQDYHVRYHASSFDGMPCLYVVHSAVEYVFQRDGLKNAPIWEPQLGHCDCDDEAAVDLPSPPGP